MIEAFITKYLLDFVIVFLVGIVSKFMISKFGEDRARKIKEAILAAMLWAEEEFGIGNGNKKWEEAWKKLIEILKKQNVKLKEGEISYVQDLMKATVPEINEKIYNAMPDSIRNARKIKVKNEKNQ
ncbi:MAG: phage holin, LLH family [Atribacterota bacterium]